MKRAMFLTWLALLTVGTFRDVSFGDENVVPGPCVGDCNADGQVTVDELLTMVNIALGNSNVSSCLAGDANHDEQITIDEILTAVNHALNGCVSVPQVIEHRQPSIKDDPAVTGNFPDGFTIPTLPEGPQESPDEGGPAWIEKMDYAPAAEVDLAPGVTKEVELQVASATVLTGSAQWIGTIAPLPVTLALDGTSLATGDAYSIGTDRGGSSVLAKSTAGGRATLSVTNTTDATVKVRLILGAFVP